MKTWQKILLADIICMTWGMLSLILLLLPSWGRINTILLLICTLSCSVAIRITHWLKFFLGFPKGLIIPIICATQFFVYSIIAFAIAIVIYKNGKSIRDTNNVPKSTHD